MRISINDELKRKDSVSRKRGGNDVFWINLIHTMNPDRVVNVILQNVASDSAGFEAVVKENILKKNITDVEDIKYFRFSEDIFTFTVSFKEWGIYHAGGGIIDYTQYEKAISRIFNILKILAEAGCISSFYGSIGVQDGDKTIYFHFVYVEKELDDALYDAYDFAYDSLDVIHKFKNKKGDMLLLFRYEETTRSGLKGAHLFAPRGEQFDTVFDVRMRTRRKGLPARLWLDLGLYWKSEKRMYKLVAGITSYISERRFTGEKCVILFDEFTIDGLLKRFRTTLWNRGFEIADFDKLKDDIMEADKKTGEKT